MDILQALLLGLVQGLTEFLPVSSSGHLELGKLLLGVDAANSLTFTVLVHGATVLSTIVVFYKDIWQLLRGLFRFRQYDSQGRPNGINQETRYILMILISMIPVLFVGVFMKEQVESAFTGNLILVGSMLLVTASLLTFSHYSKDRGKPMTFAHAFLIGISQAFAVLPGISRSGATISTGLLLGKARAETARFSFLMVLIPIIGANMLDLLSEDVSQAAPIGALPLAVGFISAFVAGLLACKWMIRLVNRGKLVYFAIYCVAIGLTAIGFGVFA